jgi:hypothetical protein
LQKQQRWTEGGGGQGRTDLDATTATGAQPQEAETRRLSPRRIDTPDLKVDRSKEEMESCAAFRRYQVARGLPIPVFVGILIFMPAAPRARGPRPSAVRGRRMKT